MANTPSVVRMGEIGYTGTPIHAGYTNDELRAELNFPQSIKTFKEMSYHSTINSSLDFYTTIITRASWSYKPPENATEEELKQVKIINEMMHDMDHSWVDFISDAMTSLQYGFSVHEKVFRRRYKSNGSKYTDGLTGWKKLAIRAQESIKKFNFDESGNNIVGVKQVIQSDMYGRFVNRKSNEVDLSMEKVIIVRQGRSKGDPYGKSPLRDAYLAWKYLVLLEELETTGVSKDLVGLPVLYIPPQYLSENATDEQKEIVRYYENAMRNLQNNEQGAMILPNAYDPDSRQPLFKIDLLSVEGKKAYDIGKIKEYYKNMIMISLGTDVLTMGQTQVGSYALGSIKNSMAGAKAQSMARMIANTINESLIRQTYQLNKWDDSRMGYLDFDDLSEVDLESISKYWQRMASVGLVEVDREVLNKIRLSGGVDSLPNDLPPQQELLSGNTSKSGEGGKTPFEGTRTQNGGGDDNSGNLENSA